MRTQTLRKHFALVVLLGAIMALLLAACTSETPPQQEDGDAEATITLEQTSAEAEQVAQAEGAASKEVSDSEDDDTTTDDVAVAPEQLNACLDCHADKEQLIATAAPEVEVVEESEGEG